MARLLLKTFSRDLKSCHHGSRHTGRTESGYVQRDRPQPCRRRLGSNRRPTGNIVLVHLARSIHILTPNQSVQICKRNVNLISGRVLVQASPRFIKDKNATIQQCRRIAKYLGEEGVSKDRFAIKLIFTGANALAAVELQSEGIKILATGVFSLEQAIAASQAKCAMVSPYFNGTKIHLGMHHGLQADQCFNRDCGSFRS